MEMNAGSLSIHVRRLSIGPVLKRLTSFSMVLKSESIISREIWFVLQECLDF